MILKGKVCLVTGAGTGIGEATAVAMAEAGAAVVAADINEQGAQATAARIAETGAKGLALAVDVREVDEIDRMVQSVVDEFGRLDVIVNNAGITKPVRIMDLTEEDWDSMYRVNVRGVFFCLQRAAQQMIAQGSGVIINMASIAGRGYIKTSNAAYSSGKGAVISLTKTAAQQLGEYNINVNAICPGITYTPMQELLVGQLCEREGITQEEALAQMTDSIPIRRMNGPEDIAAMAVFLASPSARNVSGQAYNVDGGLVPS
jgi:NAD(P)-dependent dehydrogenase (short-subunit alcohol dehydrogenase family)